MKNISLFISLVLMSTFSVLAQTTPSEGGAATTTTSLSKGLGLYVFPSNGQDQKTVDADEMECYKWAMEQTGFDPMNPTKVEAKQADTSADGSMVVGAAGGAAAGAAVGAIAGDAGKGAAIGSVVGGLRGRRAKVHGDHVEQAQNNQAAAQQEKEMKDNFNKAFTACMTGKGYTVQ